MKLFDRTCSSCGAMYRIAEFETEAGALEAGALEAEALASLDCNICGARLFGDDGKLRTARLVLSPESATFHNPSMRSSKG